MPAARRSRPQGRLSLGRARGEGGQEGPVGRRGGGAGAGGSQAEAAGRGGRVRGDHEGGHAVQAEGQGGGKVLPASWLSNPNSKSFSRPIASQIYRFFISNFAVPLKDRAHSLAAPIA